MYFVKISLRGRHTVLLEDGAVSNERDNLIFNLEIFLKGHQNRITGSRVTSIFLNGWIWSISGAPSLESLRSKGVPHLVLVQSDSSWLKAVPNFSFKSFNGLAQLEKWQLEHWALLK